MKPTSKPPAAEPFAEPQVATHLARLDALADPARLRLLALLDGEELGVGELGEIVQLPQSSVSRHLKVLLDQGWIVSRSARTANFYTMANGELPGPARSLWSLTRTEIAGWPALAHDRLRLERRLAERSETGGGFFAGVAEEWQTLRADLYGRVFGEAAIAALLPRDWVVADLACGAGDLTVRLAPWVARVIAVDASPEMLAAAKRRTRALPNVELHRADLATLPIADGSCDAALLLLALTHVAAPAEAVAEMARILKPGGRAVIVDLLRHDRDGFRRQMGQVRNGFGAEELKALLATTGFTAAECAPLPPEAEAKGPALLLAAGIRSGGLSTGTKAQTRAAAQKSR
ncbi:MAG: metalloregulator ArsR/SmtB family transcription factor [Thermoanaerobaculia bacterium]